MCRDCGAERVPVSVPFVAYESAMARAERHQKRLWVVILLLVGVLVTSNVAWLACKSNNEKPDTKEEYCIEETRGEC